MPIEAPSPRATSNKINPSDYVLCENFVFRPSTVDGFSHQTFEDGTAATTVNFKSYTQTIPDTERRLFEFLLSCVQPKPFDENH